MYKNEKEWVSGWNISQKEGIYESRTASVIRKHTSNTKQECYTIKINTITRISTKVKVNHLD